MKLGVYLNSQHREGDDPARKLAEMHDDPDDFMILVPIELDDDDHEEQIA